MDCGHGKLEDGKQIVELLKMKGKANFPSSVVHTIECDCGETFKFEKVLMNCPNCGMTYAVTPCSSADMNNIKKAGYNYA